MEVIYYLPSLATDIEKKFVAGEFPIFSNLLRGKYERRDHRTIRFGEIFDRRNVGFGNDEIVHRRRGADIGKRHHRFVFIDELCGVFLLRDRAKDARHTQYYNSVATIANVLFILPQYCEVVVLGIRQ